MAAAFVIGGVLFAVTASLLSVYVLGWYDSKLENALDSALQLELLGMAISLLVASVVFIVVLAIRVRGAKIPSGSAWIALTLGSAYPIGLLLIGRVFANLDPDSLIGMIAGVGFIVLYPAMAALVIKKHRLPSSPC